MAIHETVLVRLEGGLGNQMFQYAAGRAVALCTNRDLVLDPAAITHGSLPRSYELHAFRIAGRLVRPLEKLAVRFQVGHRIPKAVRAAARGLCARRWTLLSDAGHGFDARLFNAPGNLVLQGCWQAARYSDVDASVARTLREEFRRHEPLPAVAERVRAAVMAGESVGVHVRRGDYATDAAVAAVHGVLPASYHTAAAAAIAGRVASPRFFVFSDDVDWAKAHLRLPGPAQFIVETRGLSPSVDLTLLASCRHFIIANSTFSWWAAWLGSAVDKIVVAPRCWFAKSPLPATLLPGGWEVL